MEMTEKTFKHDMEVVFVEAASFPDGIAAAFEELKEKVGHLKRVSYFGISNPVQGTGIVYRAAAATLPAIENPETKGLQTMTIKGGNYYSIRLDDVSTDISQITKAFEKILSQPDIDPVGHCIEIYDYFSSDGLECIVRRAEK